MIGARRLIRELAHDLAESKAQAWSAMTEAANYQRQVVELAEQITVLEAIIVEQEKELAMLNRNCDRIAESGLSHE